MMFKDFFDGVMVGGIIFKEKKKEIMIFVD